MSKIDELFTKKKNVLPVFDLSKCVIQSKEDLQRVMEKVPDFKMRPVKVTPEELKIKKDFSFRMPRKEVRKLRKNNGERKPMYTYADPIPDEMKEVSLAQLCAVPINWKMLTTLRPKTKQEEEFFSRMVEMGKLQLKTRAQDKRQFALNSMVKKRKNKSGIIETRLVTCAECGEEMCDGKTCSLFGYEVFARVEPKATLSKADKEVDKGVAHKDKRGRKKPSLNSRKTKKGTHA